MFCIISCTKEAIEADQNIDISKKSDSNIGEMESYRDVNFMAKDTIKNNKQADRPNIGQNITGNFSTNNFEIAEVILVKKQIGNPIEDGSSAEYEIRFSNKNIKPINAGCCKIILINEGDLNNDGKDEISLYQAPMNGCTYSMTTYSYLDNNWKAIIPTFLIPTGCENQSEQELNRLVFKENNKLFYNKTDMSDEKMLEKKIEVKN